MEFEDMRKSNGGENTQENLRIFGIPIEKKKSFILFILEITIMQKQKNIKLNNYLKC